MNHSRKPVAERFWTKVAIPEEPNACWLWTGATTRKGYGEIGAGGQGGLGLRTHRLSWELHNGPIPDGFFVCHHCDNPPCVRPDHLFLGLNSDNQSDAYRKGRKVQQGEKNGNAKLTKAEVGAIREHHAQGHISQRELATLYQVSSSAISDILRHKRWP